MDLSQNDGSPDTSCLYIWLARDEDDIEGMIAWPMGDVIMPLVSTDSGRALRMERLAAQAAQVRGKPAVLVKFTRTETLREVTPGEGDSSG